MIVLVRYTWHWIRLHADGNQNEFDTSCIKQWIIKDSYAPLYEFFFLLMFFQH